MIKNTYLPTLTIDTINKKLKNFSRITPAATVMGSPIIGTQLKRSDQRP